MTEHVRITAEAGVMEILLDRPEKKNALTNAMYDAITDALARASGDGGVRAVVIGSGGEIFTAGNDLGDFAKVAMGGEARAAGFVEAIARLEKPLIAAVPGLAVGVGMTMLLHCDLVYLAEEAVLSAPFVDLALVPEAGSSLMLPARIGHAKAFEIFVLGKALAASEALALGLANAVLPRAEVLGAARRAATELARKSTGSVIETKRLMRDAGPLLERMAAEGEAFLARLKSRAAREAFTAFMERRKPDFEGLD